MARRLPFAAFALAIRADRESRHVGRILAVLPSIRHRSFQHGGSEFPYLVGFEFPEPPSPTSSPEKYGSIFVPTRSGALLSCVPSNTSKTWGIPAFESFCDSSAAPIGM